MKKSHGLIVLAIVAASFMAFRAGKNSIEADKKLKVEYTLQEWTGKFDTLLGLVNLTGKSLSVDQSESYKQIGQGIIQNMIVQLQPQVDTTQTKKK